MATPSQPEASRSRLSVGQLCAYGSGIIAYQFPHVALATLAMPIFNVEVGLSPVVVGAILMIGRLWDAITNPVIGNLSDNTRTRWGRRRPFLVAGAILTALAYPFVWLSPPGWDHSALSVYILIASLLLYTLFAVFSVPYLALGYELSSDFNERTRIQSWRSYFQTVSTLSVGWFLWFCQRPAFGDPVNGARWLGVIVGVAILITGLIPGIFLKEPYYQVAQRTKPEPLWPALMGTLRNKPFVVLMAVILTLMLGTMTTDALGFYVLAYYVFGGDTLAAGAMLGMTATVTGLSAFLCIPLINTLSARLGKIQALKFCLWLDILVSVAKWFLATPAHPWWWIFLGIFGQFAMLGFWIIVNSMKADACDWDEMQSGHRREGAYSAVGNLFAKAAMAMTYLLSGVLLQTLGFQASLGKVQSPDTLFWMRIWFSIAPAFFIGLCLYLMSYYRLDRARMAQVSSELVGRRGREA